MAEERDLEADAEQQPRPVASRRLSPGLIALGVGVLAAAVIAAVLLGGGRGHAPLTGPGQKPVLSPERLDIPTLEVSDIIASVPLDSSAVQRRSLTVGVVVRFAPPEGEPVDLKKLQKDFIPRVTRLQAKFRSIIIQEINTRDYGKLSSTTGQNQLLGGFKDSFNRELEKYGLNKEAVVDEVVWKDFNWN